MTSNQIKYEIAKAFMFLALSKRLITYEEMNKINEKNKVAFGVK